MTIPQLVAFYTILSGLGATVAALAFWSGVLHQKVISQGHEIRELKDAKIGERSDRDRLIVIETSLKGVKDSQDSMRRALEGVQRQLGNLMRLKSGEIVELPVQG